MPQRQSQSLLAALAIRALLLPNISAICAVGVTAMRALQDVLVRIEIISGFPGVADHRLAVAIQVPRFG
jgi:hypothetical protein